MSGKPEAEFSKRGCLISGLWTLLSLPFWLGAVALLAVSTTTESRLFAIALICLLPVPLNFLHWRKTSRRIVTVLLVLTGGTALFLCAQKAPLHTDDPQAPARMIFRDGNSHSRYSPVNLIPEIDQHILRSYLSSLIDPNLSWTRAAELRNDLRGIFAAREKDRDLAPLPTVLGPAYLEAAGFKPGPGPLFVYIPATEETSTLPALVFLHDRMGNSQGYWAVWKKIAETHRYAIVAPSFGSGNWARDGGLEAIEQARRFCVDDPRIDGNRLILAGLSHGATGVTRGGRATPDKWQGLLLLSPVIERDIIESEEFRDGWGGRKALVITGEQDKQTPPGHIRRAVSSLDEIKMEVTTHYLPGGHHFLFLSEQEQVSKLIGAWLTSL